MGRLALVGAPAGLALRRLRARPAVVAVTVIALASACGLIGWSSISVARSQETSVRLRLAELPARYRSLRVVYFTLPGEPDFRAPNVSTELRGYSGVTSRPHRIRVWHSIERNRPDGIRLAVAQDTRRDVVLADGRLPRGCAGTVCEAVALSGAAAVGDLVRLPHARSARIVGRGSIRPAALPDPSELGPRGLLVTRVGRVLAPLVRQDGSTVVTSATLEPAAVRGYALQRLRARMNATVTRLERGDDLVRASAPLTVLDALSERARVARQRLLLVAGQTSALIVAFAAFAAASRRRELTLEERQLSTLGASRAQTWTARVVETALPVGAGVVLAVAGLWGAARFIAAKHGWPRAFEHAALPPSTLAAIGVLGCAAALIILLAGSAPRPRRFGLGALELAALTALAVVVWQTWTTGALDPEDVARSGREPVIVLLPALAFFAAAVVLLRVVPALLRLGERTARSWSFGTRLAFLSAARNPGDAAAATTFVAVAVGVSLFSLQYRATLERQARDQARFAGGAAVRVVEHGRGRQPDVTPTTRYRRISDEAPTPVLRLDGDLVETAPRTGQLRVRALAIPAARLPELVGWRRGFSSLSPADLTRRLRPTPVRLHGPRLDPDARALRVWARARSDSPRLLVLHFLLPGSDFGHVGVGVLSRRWQRLRVPITPPLRGAQLVGVELSPVGVRIDFQYDPSGFVELGAIEQLRGGRWSRLASLASWRPTVTPDQRSGILVPETFLRGPVQRGVRLDFNGTLEALLHPKLGLPAPSPGFRVGPVPGIVSDGLAAHAVDGLLTLDLPGKQIPVRVVGTTRLFPTVVRRSVSFVVFDYDTLFAALNGDQPGLALPSEAWFFRPPPAGFAAAVTRPPFRLERLVDARGLEERLLADPLAAGARSVLALTALVAALLAVAGLILAMRSALGAERLQIAEYEAIGVPPRALRRSAQLRIVLLGAVGFAAAVAGALVGLRLIAAFVEVTGTGTAPLPPIVAVAAWPAVAATVAAVALVAVGGAALLAARALRDPAARRLRA